MKRREEKRRRGEEERREREKASKSVRSSGKLRMEEYGQEV